MPSTALWRLLPLILLPALVLSACAGRSGVAIRDNLALLEQFRDQSYGTGFIVNSAFIGEVSAVGELTPMKTDRWSIPDGLLPLGQLSRAIGYFLEIHDQKQLWLYNLENGSQSMVLDLRQTERHLARTIAYSEKWLVWIEIETGKPDLLYTLMLRDLSDPDSADRSLDSETLTAMEAAFLPFDSLSLQGDQLAYRHSMFEGGWRDTQIKLVDLATGASSILAAAHGAAGRMILSCSLNSDLLAWDIQTVYQTDQGDFPPLRYAGYDLFIYRTDTGQLNPGEPQLTQLTRNYSFHSPVVHRGSIYVAEGEGEVPMSIIRIEPRFAYQYAIVPGEYLTVLGNYGPSTEIIPLALSDAGPLSAGKRFLFWNARYEEELFFFDTQSSSFLRFEADILEDRQSPARNHAQTSWLRLLPGLDADYFALGYVGEVAPRYLIRLE